MDIILNGVKANRDTIISFAKNPKKEGSLAHGRYGKYSRCKTVGSYLDKCAKDDSMKKYAKADLRWDHEKGYLTIVK